MRKLLIFSFNIVNKTKEYTYSMHLKSKLFSYKINPTNLLTFKNWFICWSKIRVFWSCSISIPISIHVLQPTIKTYTLHDNVMHCHVYNYVDCIPGNARVLQSALHPKLIHVLCTAPVGHAFPIHVPLLGVQCRVRGLSDHARSSTTTSGELEATPWHK